MLIPMFPSSPAPFAAAAMMPGPAPATIIQPLERRSRARSSVTRESGASRGVRAEPKIVT